MAQVLAIVWPCNHLRGILDALEARSWHSGVSREVAGDCRVRGDHREV